MKVPSAVIASDGLMKLWIYQTLARTLCPHCALTKTQAFEHFDDAQKKRVNKWYEKQESWADLEKVRFANPAGCAHCHKGEKGRTALVEMILLDDEDRGYLMREEYDKWGKALIDKGFQPIYKHAETKVLRGEIDIFTAASRVDGIFDITSSEAYGCLKEQMNVQKETEPKGAS